jgi:hypothetical protein
MIGTRTASTFGTVPWSSAGSGNGDNASTELDGAWLEIRRMIEGAARFGRFDDDGGQVVGWWPTKPEDVDAAGRPLRLYHKTFDPLTASEADDVGRPWLVGGLPGVLNQFLSRCSNGLEFASGDLVILGQRRRRTLDPDSGFGGVTAEGRLKLKFARWGQDLVWMDVGDGSIGAAPTGTRYLRTWESLTGFLVESCREHLASFDVDGRRIGFATLPSPSPPPSNLDFLPCEFRPQAARVTRMLTNAGRPITVQDATFEIFHSSQLPAAQVGYSIDSEGEPMGGQGDGQWKPYWLAIGSDTELGDPLIVDLSSASLQVLTAAHGGGRWELDQVADSLESLLAKH